MNSILFHSKHLKFFFKKGTSVLVVYDTSLLAHSRRFIYSVYRRRVCSSPSKFPQVFDLRDGRAMLILNLSIAHLILPIKYIHVIHDVKHGIFSFEVYTRYDERTYKRIERASKKCMVFEDGDVRSTPATGAIVFYETDENRKEVADITIALLNIHSPDEIIQKYM